MATIEKPLIDSATTSLIGQSVDKADGIEKVRGDGGVFFGDLGLPDMLVGRVLRARYPHARILKIDASRARALPGVAVVVTAADIPGAKAIGRMNDQWVLCEDKVRYLGDAVALVAAEDSVIAAHALELIDVEYQELPAVFTPLEAVSPGAPLVHERHGSNVLFTFKLRKGDVDAAFAGCDVIVENTYRVPTSDHAYMEVEGALAMKNADGTVTVFMASQMAFRVRNSIAQVLNLPLESVRLISTNAGGAFGGKEDAEPGCRAALLAYLSGRPVKLVYSREESLISSTKRHACVIEYKSGATKDGRLQAVEVRVYLNKGAFANVGGNMPPASGVTTKSGYHVPGPYVIPNVRVDSSNIYTNLPAGGAIRGFGVPHMAFAHESQVDELASRLKMDPAEFRLLNGLEAGSRTSCNQLLEYSVGLKECIRQATKEAGWKQFHAEKARQPQGIRKRGMGISSFMFATTPGLWPEYANATMEIDHTGRIIVRTGVEEMGQGARTVFAQIAAQALEVPIEHVMVSPRGDSAVDQDSLQTTSSRATICAGNAILRAAAEARPALLEMAAQKLRVTPELVVKEHDKFRRLDTGETIPLGDVLRYSFACGRRLIGKGWWCTPEPKIDPATGQGNPFHIYAYGAQVIEVEVNTETGEFEVKRVVAAQDVGKAINPRMVIGQMVGGVVMGLGMAMTEELVCDKGRFVNTSFANFLVPTVADVPEIVPIMVEDPYPNGPFGAKGVGEPGTVATAAAVANAICDAVGVRITQLPITAERVWRALQEKKKSAAAAK